MTTAPTSTDGSITVALKGGGGYTLGASSSVTVAASDDDVPAPPPVNDKGITVTAGTPTITEGELAVFHIKANPVPQPYTLAARYHMTTEGSMISAPRSTRAATAFMQHDGIIEIGVRTRDDSRDESDGKITLSLTGVMGDGVLGSTITATITVLDND